MKLKIALVAVAAVAAAMQVPAGLAASKGSGVNVSIAHSTLGRILVDGRGHAVYLFENDTRGSSSCYGVCAASWRPMIVSGRPRGTSGVRGALLGRTKRKDGRWQVTYNRHPLYTFALDRKKGQTNGEGVSAFGAQWYLVSPGGAKVEGAASTMDQPAPTGYGGDGGY
jgi:predicted lipoprotein with Yx(FWY)xxD motif